jgi:hypothetical protein
VQLAGVEGRLFAPHLSDWCGGVSLGCSAPMSKADAAEVDALLAVARAKKKKKEAVRG